jgi:hypothetical protein
MRSLLAPMIQRTVNALIRILVINALAALRVIETRKDSALSAHEKSARWEFVSRVTVFVHLAFLERIAISVLIIMMSFQIVPVQEFVKQRQYLPIFMRKAFRLEVLRKPILLSIFTEFLQSLPIIQLLKIFRS